MARTETHVRRPGARQRGRRSLTVASIVGIVVLAVACGSLINISTTRNGPFTRSVRAALPIPESLRHPMAVAAQSCPILTSARLAGQVMAASGFDPDTKATNGGAGIAGLTDAEWQRWAPGPDAVRTDPEASLIALAHHVCDLVGTIRSAHVAGDLWHLALAGYDAGVDAVVTTHGIPSAAVAYVNRVAEYAAWYEAQADDPTPSESSGSEIAPGPSASLPPAPSPSVSTVATTPATRRPVPSPPKVWNQVTISATTVLALGQSVHSNRTTLLMRTDGDLAIYDENDQLRWTSGTAGRGDRAIFQADGNFVVYDTTMTSVWTSNTPGHDGAVLVIRADGNVCVVYQEQVIWASNTAQ